jgi:hypothetical protein
MAAFFIPGMSGQTRVVEDAYVEMRKAVELDMGRRPSDRRILQLWARRGKVDCFTEVGRPDPIHGGTVIAIFDLGLHQPFVVSRQPEAGTLGGVYDVLACNAYSVLEFQP